MAGESAPSPGVQKLLDEYWEAAGDDLAFAARAEIDVRTWRRWKSGEISPTDAKLQDVRRRLDVFRIAEQMLRGRSRETVQDTDRAKNDDAGAVAAQNLSGVPSHRAKAEIKTSPVTPALETPGGLHKGVRMDSATMIYNIVLRWKERDRQRLLGGLLSPPGTVAAPHPAARSQLLRKRRKG